MLKMAFIFSSMPNGIAAADLLLVPWHVSPTRARCDDHAEQTGKGRDKSLPSSFTLSFLLSSIHLPLWFRWYVHPSLTSLHYLTPLCASSLHPSFQSHLNPTVPSFHLCGTVFCSFTSYQLSFFFGICLLGWRKSQQLIQGNIDQKLNVQGNSLIKNEQLTALSMIVFNLYFENWNKTDPYTTQVFAWMIIFIFHMQLSKRDGNIGKELSVSSVPIGAHFWIFENWKQSNRPKTPCAKAEVAAGRPRPCGKTEFTCSNQRCIPAQLQCDLFSDCGDGGSDERDCKACEYGRAPTRGRTHQRGSLYEIIAPIFNHFTDFIGKCDVWLFMLMRCMVPVFDACRV